MEPTPNKFCVVLVSKSWKGKLAVKVKDRAPTREAGEAMKKARLAKCVGWAAKADYRVLGPVQFKKLMAEVSSVQADRRAKGAKKAAATRAKRKTKSEFVLCPTCRCKSKKLFSEFGGLQTRRCQRGHTFEYDKWIADRAFWGPILGAGIPDPYVRK